VSRAEALLPAAVIFAVALVVRIWAASLIVFPQPEDTAYYVAVARNLLDGRGLITDALWSYQTPPLEVPRAAFEVWLPLPTFVAAIPMAVLGKTFQAAQWSSIVVGALVPVLAWRLAADVAVGRALPPGRARVLAIGTGLTAAVYLPLVLHSALPDSTMPFATLVLAACLLMHRIIHDPGGAAARDKRLVMLGVVIGLAAWTRNEAIWLGLTWALVVWLVRSPVEAVPRARLRMIAVVAAVAVVVFAPWAIRDTLEFGTPLPGQALTNALSIKGTDIFAWQDPPTLSRYLAVGPVALAGMRVDGTLHNLVNVLLYLGVPVAAIGLVALTWFVRARALRPLLVFSILTFAVDSLLFPVSTTWGTFLHAAGAIHVLLIVSCLQALDALIARVGVIRGWTRPVAWLGTTLTVAASILFSAVLLPTFGSDSGKTAARYDALNRNLVANGMSPADIGPIISDFPIWLSYATGARSLGLPSEPIADVLDLARTFDSKVAVVANRREDSDSIWPDVLDDHDPGWECFGEAPVFGATNGVTERAMFPTRVFRIVCP
jgi:hypothetical protein